MLNRSWLLVLLTGLLFSCTSSRIATYPDSWAEPEPVSQDGCADLSGRYENRAIDAPDNENAQRHQTHPRFLSEFLVARLLVNGYKHEWITTVRFARSGEENLSVDYFKQDKIIFSDTLEKNGDFSCTPDGVVFESSYTKIYEVGGGVGKRVTRLIFFKARDGSLMLTEDFSEKGIASVLLPIPGSEKKVSRYRFPAVEANP